MACVPFLLEWINRHPFKDDPKAYLWLTSECWSVQVWGLPYCSGFGDYEGMCEFVATEECGGRNVRKRILSGKYPLNGLPDEGSV